MTTPARQEEFQSLIDEHRKIVYKVCHTYCKDAGARDDLAQEIVLELWRGFDKFDGRARFSTWMYRIALNVAISYHRRDSTRTRYVISDEERLLETAADTPVQSDQMSALYGFIDGLDPLNKALVLLYLDGHNYQEIADVLGISGTNVATKISRLKEAMRKQLT